MDWRPLSAIVSVVVGIVSVPCDYAYLVAYGLFLSGACVAVADRAHRAGRRRLAALGPPLAWGALAAAACDAVENAALLLILDRFYRFKPPALFALYVALYSGFRFFLEQLRIDPSKELLGMRLNAWVALVVFIAAVAFFVWWQFFRGGRLPRPRAVELKLGVAILLRFWGFRSLRRTHGLGPRC